MLLVVLGPRTVGSAVPVVTPFFRLIKKRDIILTIKFLRFYGGREDEGSMILTTVVMSLRVIIIPTSATTIPFRVVPRRFRHAEEFTIIMTVMMSLRVVSVRVVNVSGVGISVRVVKVSGVVRSVRVVNVSGVVISDRVVGVMGVNVRWMRCG
jgi:hypothetical protein